eukprot:Amastigsp_a665_73.p1 type:complete len:134 gc:universal Amastigsp_a665_73:636-235(-)
MARYARKLEMRTMISDAVASMAVKCIREKLRTQRNSSSNQHPRAQNAREVAPRENTKHEASRSRARYDVTVMNTGLESSVMSCPFSLSHCTWRRSLLTLQRTAGPVCPTKHRISWALRTVATSDRLRQRTAFG